ncbi:phosphosulfolactate synthase [Bordetella genomosp. 11]|nr:phosphosulfolactate synthase [Bordetella genomosp. 11]
MPQTAYHMLEVPRLPPKPRTRSMIVMSETCIPLRQTEDLIEVAGSLIDYAKLTDHAGLIDRHSEAWIRRKIALYNDHGIPVIPGGIPFQVAVIQDKVNEFLQAVRDLGFAGVEMSEDTMPPLETGYREDLIRRALDMGLPVMTEMGRKNVDIPFNADEICEQILRDVELGVSKVYLESAEIQEIFEADPAALDKIASLGKNEFLLFELGLQNAQEKAAWLVERYGMDINFASVSPADVVPVDAIRRGVHRKAGFSYVTQYGRQ